MELTLQGKDLGRGKQLMELVSNDPRTEAQTQDHQPPRGGCGLAVL